MPVEGLHVYSEYPLLFAIFAASLSELAIPRVEAPRYPITPPSAAPCNAGAERYEYEPQEFKPKQMSSNKQQIVFLCFICEYVKSRRVYF